MQKVSPPFSSQPVADAFAAAPDALRPPLLALRALIFDIAAELPIPQIAETLKWGQPSYTTRKSTPLRLSCTKAGQIAVLAHCQSSVIGDFRALFPTEFTYDGSRAVLLQPEAPLPFAPLRLLIRGALTYRV